MVNPVAKPRLRARLLRLRHRPHRDLLSLVAARVHVERPARLVHEAHVLAQALGLEDPFAPRAGVGIRLQQPRGAVADPAVGQQLDAP